VTSGEVAFEPSSSEPEFNPSAATAASSNSSSSIDVDVKAESLDGAAVADASPELEVTESAPFGL